MDPSSNEDKQVPKNINQLKYVKRKEKREIKMKMQLTFRY